MSISGFYFKHRGVTGFQAIRSQTGKPSTQYAKNQALIYEAPSTTGGGVLIPNNSQTGIIAGILVAVEFVGFSTERGTGTAKFLTGTDGAKLRFYQADLGDIWTVNVPTLLEDNISVTSSTSTTVVLTTANSPSADDYNGGVVLCAGQQRRIVDSAISSTTLTLTVDRAWDTNPTTSDKVNALAFGPGFRPKMHGTNYSTQLSVAIADRNNGVSVLVHKVRLKTGGRSEVDVEFLKAIA
jgi:hypothetical protein